MNQKVSWAFMDLFRNVFSALDVGATRMHVIMTTASNNTLWTPETVNFLIFSSSICVGALSSKMITEEDVQNGEMIQLMVPDVQSPR